MLPQFEAMTKEQKEKMLEKANQALVDYIEGNCSPSSGYNVLRYAKAGLYNAKELPND